MLENFMKIILILIIFVQSNIILGIAIIGLGKLIRRYNIKRIYEVYGVEVQDKCELNSLLNNFSISEDNTKKIMFDNKIKKQDILSVCIDIWVINFLYRFCVNIVNRINEYVDKNIT